MGKDGPAIKIGNIDDAEFTVNRYALRDGEVVEQEVSATLSDDEMADFEDEIDADLDDAVEEYEETGEVPTEGTTQLDEQKAVEDVLPTARQVVNDEEITKNNWPSFASAMRDVGVSEQSLLSDVWSELRAQDALVAVGDEPDGPDTTKTDEADGSTDSADESDTTTDDADSDSAETAETGDTPPENIAEMSMGEVLDGADAAYLAVSPGDAESDAATDQFIDQIQRGDIQTLNVDTSVNADDILADAGLDKDEVPVVILKYGESHYAYEDLVDELPDVDDGDQTDSGGADDPDADPGGSGGGSGEAEVTPGDLEGVEPGDIALIMEPDVESSEQLVNQLLEPISNEEIIAVPVESMNGAAILDTLPDGVKVPVPVEVEQGGFAKRELEWLAEKYA